MPYEKQLWEPRDGTGLNKFTDQLTGKLMELVSTPDSVTSPGSPFSVDRMNHMEDGIYDAVQKAEQALSGGAQQYIRNRPPTATDDISAGVKPGHTWIVPQMTFHNYVPNAAAPNAAAWTLSNGALVTSGTKVQLTAANGLAYSTAYIGLGKAAVPGHVYFLRGIVSALDASATSISLYIEDTNGHAQALNRATPTAGTAYTLSTRFVMPSDWSGNLQIRIRMDYSTASAINGKRMTLDAPLILDLTADMGAGLEFTEAQAIDYAAQFTPIFQTEHYKYSGNYWVCDDSTTGAANWWKIPNLNDVPTAVLTLNTVPGAAVTITIDDIILKGTAGSNGIATLYPAKLGTWAVEVKTAASTYTGTVVINTIGYVTAKVPTFGAMSWADINIVAQAGAAATVFTAGDEKSVTLTTSEVVTLRVEDFNHDDLVSGGKAKMTIAMKNLFAATQNMNASNTNVGSWSSSAMRTRMATYLAQLPADLQAIIKPVIKKTTAGNQSTSIQTTNDSLWLFSAIEVGLQTAVAGYNGEGATYPLFVDNASRIKYMSNGSGSVYIWWFRSPHATSATDFALAHTDGSFSINSASYSYGVCVGLCV